MVADRNGGDQQSAQVLAQLMDAARRFRSNDCFGAMGLSAQVSKPAVEDRYAELAGRFHPHHYARYESKEIKDAATKAFVALGRCKAACVELVESRTGVVPQKRKVPRLGKGGQSPTLRAISRAKRLMDLHQYDGAATIVEEALKLNPKDMQLLTFRYIVEGRRCRSEERWEAAVNAYEEVLDMDHEHEEARVELEVLNRKLDRQEGGFIKKLFRRGS